MDSYSILCTVQYTVYRTVYSIPYIILYAIQYCTLCSVQYMNPFFPRGKNGDSPLVINSNSWKSHFLSGEKNGCRLPAMGWAGLGRPQAQI